jgi:hypothetical protein
VLAGQKPGIKEADDGIWLASFMQYDLGYFDLEQKTMQPSTTRSARGCHPCLRYDLLPMSPGWILDKLLTGGESVRLLIVRSCSVTFIDVEKAPVNSTLLKLVVLARSSPSV